MSGEHISMAGRTIFGYVHSVCAYFFFYHCFVVERYTVKLPDVQSKNVCTLRVYNKKIDRNRPFNFELLINTI